MINFKCIEAIMRAIKKEFPDLTCCTHGYGDSMEENYFRYYNKSKIDKNHCIRAIIFKGGFCNDWDEVNKCYNLGTDVEFFFKFKDGINPDAVWKIAREVAGKYGYSFMAERYSSGVAYVYERIE